MNRKDWLKGLEARRNEIYKYKVEQGHTFFQTAIHFRINPSRVVQIVNRVKNDKKSEK